MAAELLTMATGLYGYKRENTCPFSKESLRKEFENNGLEVEGFYSNVAGGAFEPDSL